MVYDTNTDAQQTSRVKRSTTIADARDNAFQRRRYLSSRIERQTLMVVGYRSSAVGDIACGSEGDALIDTSRNGRFKCGP